MRGSMGTTRTLQPRGSHKPTRNPQSHRDPKGTKLPAGTHLPPQTYFLTSSTAATALTSSTATTASTMGVGLGDAACGDSTWSPMGSEHPKPTSGSGGGDGWTPTSCPGLSRVLVHFFFMSVSSLLGFSPPLHLSPGILRYLKQNRGGEEMLCEPQDPPRPPSHPVVPHGRCSIGDVPAGAQQLAAAVEAELQVVALQLGLLHAHRLVLRAVIAEIAAGGGERLQPPVLRPQQEWGSSGRGCGGTGVELG